MCALCGRGGPASQRSGRGRVMEDWEDAVVGVEGLLTSTVATGWSKEPFILLVADWWKLFRCCVVRGYAARLTVGTSALVTALCSGRRPEVETSLEVEAVKTMIARFGCRSYMCSIADYEVAPCKQLWDVIWKDAFLVAAGFRGSVVLR